MLVSCFKTVRNGVEPIQWNGMRATNMKKDPTNSLPMASPLPCPTVEVLIENQCFWVHSALTVDEQIEVLGDILDRCKHTVDEERDSRKRGCMNPSPETLFLKDCHNPTLHFGYDDSGVVSLSSVYNKAILQKVMPLISSKLQTCPDQNNVDSQCSKDLYNSYSISVIRYDAPNGSFPEHVDHCNESPNGWVVLLSLGCTARFSVRNQAMASKKILELTSGDVMVFDPSTKAAIRHGVTSILPSTCPMKLQHAFGVQSTSNHRYGVQCRTSVKK